MKRLKFIVQIRKQQSPKYHLSESRNLPYLCKAVLVLRTSRYCAMFMYTHRTCIIVTQLHLPSTLYKVASFHHVIIFQIRSCLTTDKTSHRSNRAEPSLPKGPLSSFHRRRRSSDKDRTSNKDLKNQFGKCELVDGKNSSDWGSAYYSNTNYFWLLTTYTSG